MMYVSFTRPLLEDGSISDGGDSSEEICVPVKFFHNAGFNLICIGMTNGDEKWIQNDSDGFFKWEGKKYFDVSVFCK